MEPLQALQPLLLGNDIVDLSDTGSVGKAEDRRFVDRVFSASEQLQIRESADPDFTLWAIWAAKESAFKIFRKISPAAVFSHREFVVEDSLPPIASRGVVRFGQLRFPVIWTWENAGHCVGHSIAPGRKEYIHCVSGWKGDRTSDGREDLHRIAFGVEGLARNLTSELNRLSSEELESVHSDSSLQVRLLAKRLLHERFGLSGAQIIRRRKALGNYGPPMVVTDGLGESLDVSLSHDGRFVAASISGRKNQSNSGGTQARL